MSVDPEKVGDASDSVEDMDDEEEAGDIKSQILKRPDLVAVIQARLAAAEAKQVQNVYLSTIQTHSNHTMWMKQNLNKK